MRALVGKAKAVEAQRQWGRTEQLLARLQADGLDHDLSSHDGVRALLEQHQQLQAELVPDITAILDAAEACPPPPAPSPGLPIPSPGVRS